MNMHDNTKAESSPARILVVDDEVYILQVVALKLRNAGLEVECAGDGDEAFTLLKGKSFDLVVTDLQMPVMGGYEATMKIRSDARFAKLPIIAMTAHATIEEKQKWSTISRCPHLI